MLLVWNGDEPSKSPPVSNGSPAEEKISAVLISPLLVILTFPAFPPTEKDANSSALVSTLPPVLSRVIFPPLPLPSERESI